MKKIFASLMIAIPIFSHSQDQNKFNKAEALNCTYEYAAAVNVYKMYRNAFIKNNGYSKMEVGALEVMAWEYISGATYMTMVLQSNDYRKGIGAEEWDGSIRNKIAQYGEDLSSNNIEARVKARTKKCQDKIGKKEIDKLTEKIFITKDDRSINIISSPWDFTR